jgi:hypothetical protein
MTDIRAARTALFRNLESPGTQDRFWAQVADDVDWTVEGTHPLAGRYQGKDKFTEATFARLGRVMRDGVRLKLEHLYLDGDTAVAELAADAVTRDGVPFGNRYCWVCRFDGDTIVAVRAYLDSAMVAYAVARGEADF